jgi:MFS family permease
LATSGGLIGAVIGIIAIAFISDNFGRRRALLITLSLVTVGSIIVGISSSLAMATVGLIIVGSGSGSCTVTAICYFAEIFTD